MGTTCSDQYKESQEIVLNSKQDNKQYIYQIEINNNMNVLFFQKNNSDGQIQISKQKQKKIKKQYIQLTTKQLGCKELSQQNNSDKINKHSGAPNILTNLEQINSLSWSQQLEFDNKKVVVKQTTCWDGQELLKVGGYYIDSQKKGIWKEIIKNYCSKATVYELGEYFQGQKQGRWIYIFNNKNLYCNDTNVIIGHGSYKEQGQKHGKWIEVSEMTYKGEYKNGQKNGIWDCYQNLNGKYYLIGGGLYKDQIEGDSIKNGTWIEICDGYWDMSQITYIGLYKNGNKVGRWYTYQSYHSQKYLIGGGSYTNQIEGTSIKIGKWIELNDWFWMGSQVLYVGQYKNSKKVGRWDIRFSNQSMNHTLEIGGGLYNDDVENDQFKIGNWIELSDGFRDESQVTYHGKYQNGQKVGKWNIVWKYEENNYQIGGGFYKEEIEVSSIKIGNWIEISDDFSDSWQFILCGEYINGKKIGKWIEKQMGYTWEKEIIYVN